MAAPRLRKLAAVTVAGVTALALVAGCGGSDVTEGAIGTDGAAVQSDAGVVEPGQVPADTTAGAPAAGAAEAGTTGGTAPQAPAGRAGAPAGSTTADQSGSKQTGGKPAAGGAGTGAAASSSAAERLVASHPMFGGTAACKPATLSEVPLGNVSTTSGVLGEIFSPVVNALNVWVASANACGGLNGHRIKLYFDDDQGDPTTASTKVQNMISSKKILAFVGNIQVLTVDAVAPIIKRTGIPIIGSDISNTTWFTNPLMFPQGAPQQSIAYGFLHGALNYYKVKNVGLFYCIEVPRSCGDTAVAVKDLAPKMGAVLKVSSQVSLTQPSFVQQCLEMKNAGVEAVAFNMDAASIKRIARSCEQVGFFPKGKMGHPLGVGSEKQFLGSKWLGSSYVPLNVFGWMADSTPAEKFYQAQVRRFDPGFDTGGAATIGWTAAALTMAAGANLSPENPTTQQLLDTLWTFKGQKFTELGGLTGPRTFGKDANPRVPYCLFEAVLNEEGTGWKSVTSKPTCTNMIAPSDPQGRR